MMVRASCDLAGHPVEMSNLGRVQTIHAPVHRELNIHVGWFYTLQLDQYERL